MMAGLNGWQRGGVILALIWAFTCPLVLGPIAQNNRAACVQAKQFEPGGEWAGQVPGSLNEKASSGLNIFYYPSPKPLLCLDGWEEGFDLRAYPFGAKSGADFLIVTVLAFFYFIAEAGIPVVLAWTAVRVLISTTKWVRAGFRDAQGAAEG
jgi:hypothetical protein